jgi:hypothetical protein
MKSRLKTILRILFFGLTLFLVQTDSKADHVVGSDVAYTCLGSGNYNLTFKLYRDCQGIQLCPGCPNGLSPSCAISVGITGATIPTGANIPAQTCTGVNFGNTSLTVVPGISGLDVIQLCALTKTICSNCGTRTPGTFTPGIEIYVFTGMVNLSAIPSNCCLVRIGWQTCCRNNAITTLQNPASLGFFTETLINRCATPCNSSPTFTNDAVAVACAGQEFAYNLGAIDPDGDSLSYRFGQSLVAPGAGAPYASPYSPNVPFPYLGVPGQSPPLLPPLGIFIDPMSGDIRFTPLGTFVANLVVEVLQWKIVGGVYVLMGVTRRDIQFYSQVCPNNNPPVIRTYKEDGTLTAPSPNFVYGVCAGQPFCFIVSAWDNTAGWDTTDLNWPQPVGGPDPNPIFTTGGTITRLYNPNTRAVLGPKFDSVK